MAAVKSKVKLFGGVLQRMTHTSKVCACDMTFAVYLRGPSALLALRADMHR